MKYIRIPIVRKEGITIYGRVIDTKGKLGRYEVMSEQSGHDGNVYCLFSDAESKMDHLLYEEGKRDHAKR